MAFAVDPTTGGPTNTSGTGGDFPDYITFKNGVVSLDGLASATSPLESSA
jgi:hypothetical protein